MNTPAVAGVTAAVSICIAVSPAVCVVSAVSICIAILAAVSAAPAVASVPTAVRVSIAVLTISEQPARAARGPLTIDLVRTFRLTHNTKTQPGHC